MHGNSGAAVERSECVDPLAVAREVERRFGRLWAEAREQAFRTGGPPDVRRMNLLHQEWQDAAKRLNQLEWEASRR